MMVIAGIVGCTAVRSKRFAIATLRLDGVDLRLKYADLLVAAPEGATQLDWECVVMPFDGEPLEQGAYRVEVVTLEGRDLGGDAVLVRSVQGTHVLRGAGPLTGFTETELDE
jgi:hypothetical protein